jgi:ketosteroid isomerase-like protein
MKTLLLSISFLCFSHLAVHAQKTDEDRILLLLSQQVDAWNRGSLDEYMKGYWEHDSLAFIGKIGLTYGYEKTLANYKKSYPDKESMGTLTSTVHHLVRTGPDHFFVIGQWALERTKGELSGYFTLLLQRLNGEWVIVADHSS